MNVRFEWQFDEDGQMIGGEALGRASGEKPKPVDLIRWQLRFLRASCGRANLWGAGEHMTLTRRQRRLDAALARTRPWLCPLVNRE